MSASRRRSASSYQQLYNNSRATSAVTPRRHPNSRTASTHGPLISTNGAGNRSSRASSPSRERQRNRFRTRVADVMPLFSVEGSVRYVEVIADRIVWTADCDGAIRVRSFPKGGEMRTLRGRNGAFCTCLLHIKSTGKVWAGLSDGFILSFDVNTFALEKEFMQHDGAVFCMIELEGNVYTGGQDWKVFQWNSELCQYERQFFGHSNGVRCFCTYSGPTGAVLFSGADDGTVKAWDPYYPILQSKDETACMHTFSGHTLGVLAMELVSPLNQLWSASEDCTIRVWDLHTLKCVSTLQGHSAPVNSIQLVERRVWSGDKHGQILLWDLKTLSPVQDLSGRIRIPHDSVLCIRKILPTLTWKVWTTGSSGYIHCWNAESLPIVFDEDAMAQSNGAEEDQQESEKRLQDVNATLRDKLARLHEELDQARENARLREFDEIQAQQQLMDENAALRRHLHDPQERTQDNDGQGDHTKKPYQTDSTTADHLSSVGCSSASRQLQPPTEMGDEPPIVTYHERRFYGSGWVDVLSDVPAEARVAFTRDASEAIGLPPNKFLGLTMTTEEEALVARVDVTHNESAPADEIQQQLEAYTFPRVQQLYGNTLYNRYREISDALAAAEHQNATVQDVVHGIIADQKAQEETIEKQRGEIEELEKQVESLTSENRTLRNEKELWNKQRRLQEDHDAAKSKTSNMEEEYEALKQYLDNQLKPTISRLRRLNAEKNLDLKSNTEHINHLEEENKALKEKNHAVEEERNALQEALNFLELDKNELQEALKQQEDRSVSKIPNVEEEYEALKQYVNNQIKPMISRLKRINGEKALDLKSNEDHIKKVEEENKALQEALNELAYAQEAKNSSKVTSIEEEYEALKNYVDNQVKPTISRLKRLNGENALDLKANEDHMKKLEDENKFLRNEKKQLEEALRQEGSSAPRSAFVEEEYEALKQYVDDRVKPTISRLKRLNAENGLDLQAKDEEIRKLKEETKSLQKALNQEATSKPRMANLEEEYDALKVYVDKQVKPSISRLKRENAESGLDLQAKDKQNELLVEENKFLKDEKKALEEALAQQTANASRNLNVKRECEAFKDNVDDQVKPTVSRLKKQPDEKSLDLKANEYHMKKLEDENKFLRAVNKTLEESLNKQKFVKAVPDKIPNVEEEYEALKQYVDNRVKPMVSKLKRMNTEKGIDLKENEDRIKKLEEENNLLGNEKKRLEEALKQQAKTTQKNSNVEEEYEALKQHIDNHVMPTISRLKQLNTEKDLDLQSKDNRIGELERQLESNNSGMVVSPRTVEGLQKDKNDLQQSLLRVLEENQMLLDAVADAEESANAREATSPDRKHSHTSRSLPQDALEAKCAALQTERDKLKDLLRVPGTAGSQALLDAYRNEVKRRRKAEDELHHLRRSLERRPGDDKSLAAQNLALSVRLGDLEAVAEDLRVTLDESLRRIHDSESDSDKMRDYLLTLLSGAPPSYVAPLSPDDLQRISGGNEQLLWELRQRSSNPPSDGVASNRQCQPSNSGWISNHGDRSRSEQL